MYNSNNEHCLMSYSCKANNSNDCVVCVEFNIYILSMIHKLIKPSDYAAENIASIQ